MTSTNDVKTELLGAKTSNVKERVAEITTILRLAGGLHLISGRVALEAEADRPETIVLVRRALHEIYGVVSEARKTPLKGHGKQTSSYLIRVIPGETISRQLGLLDNRRRQIRGLPNSITTGTKKDLAAAWRGAFLARGSLSHSGRSASLEIVCPTNEVAMALSGAATRIGITARVREIRSEIKVLIRDDEAIGMMLDYMGAPESAKEWRNIRENRESRANANRLVNFDDANLRRSAQASVNACARVERALDILGEDVPEHLKYAGELRLSNRTASLNELGAQADPPLTKDAIAGRIRRLLAMADKEAATKGIPDTQIEFN